MKKYRVCGVTEVTVYKEVWANSEDEAMEKASDKLSSLTAYCGNGGGDKLIGVAEYDESVEASDYIEWNDTEVLEDNPDYFECPECGEECEVHETKDGEKYYWCEDCEQAYDEDGDKTWIDEEEDDKE